MKNTPNRINSRLETWEENTHELDGLWRKTTRSEALRENRLEEMLFGTTASILTRVTGVLDKRGTKTLTWKSACPKAQWNRDWEGTESIDQLGKDDSWDHWLPRPPTRRLLVHLRVLVFLSAVCCNFYCRGFAHFWTFFLSIVCFWQYHKWGCVLASGAPKTRGYKVAHNKRSVFAQFWRPCIRAGALDLQMPHSRLCLHPHEAFALAVQQHPFAFWAHLAPVWPCLCRGTCFQMRSQSQARGEDFCIFSVSVSFEEIQFNPQQVLTCFSNWCKYTGIQ